MSRNEAFSNAGNAWRYAIAGMLGYFFGLQYVAVTIVISSLLTSIVVLRVRRSAINDVVARAGESDDQPTWRALMGTHGLLLLALTVLIYQAASSAMLPFLAEARTAAGSNPSITTAVMCVVSRGCMIPAALMAPYIARRRGYASVMTLVLATVGVRACLAYFAHAWATVIFVEILEGAAAGMALVAIPVLNAELMAGTGRATAALGVVLTTFGAGATLSPLIGGFVANRFGFGGCFIAFALVAFVGILVWTFGQYFLSARERANAESRDPSVAATGLD